VLTVIRAKACKRCGGDLSLECDIYGVYIQCIQCGATYNKDELVLYNRRDIENSLKAVRARPPATAPRRR
jgi:tRNA(Ile2) C34 agmatinyltransferase TiaS